MNELVGTGALVRFAVRRARVRIAVWVVGIAALSLASGASIKGIYPDEASLAPAALVAQSSAASIFFNGPVQALDTYGGRIAFEVGSSAMVMAALMAIFMTGFFTRSEEENGRTELLLATPLGRHAPLVAGLVVVVAMDLALGILLALSFVALGLPLAGSVAFGSMIAGVALVFTAVAAVAAQVTENTRVVYGSAGALLGLAFLVRAIGDIGDGTLSWLSPLGWGHKVRSFAEERWEVLGLFGGAALVLGVAAWVLASHRDVGAGLVAPRPGPPGAAAGLRSPLGLALRLQRASVIGWAVGLAIMGASFGSVANDVEDFVQDSEQMREFITLGQSGTLLDLYFATAMLMLALTGSGFAVQSVLRLQSEESALRAEPLLAAPVARARWVASHLIISVIGSAVVFAAGGFGAGVAMGAVTGDFSRLGELTGASLAYLPAVWVIAGVALLLFGALPRLTLLAWAVLTATVVIGFLGDLLRLPDWLVAVSPYDHVPFVPAQDLRALPLLLLTAVAAALMSGGVAGFRRRDTPA